MKIVIICYIKSILPIIFITFYCLTFTNKNISTKENILSFKTFSQFYEDLILFCIFHDVKKGFYIDIGANDPDIISVTKAFYLRGWNGINIEPLPKEFNSLIKKRPRDINLQIGAGMKKGNSTLYIYKGKSTMIRKFAVVLNDTINIQIDTMSNVCKNYIPNKLDIQFCKIDVEGEEKNVLLGYDFKNYRPNIFLIESTYPGTYKPSYPLWEYILLENDYSFIYEYNINRFYIDNKKPELKNKFTFVNNYIKLYNENKIKKKKNIKFVKNL